MRTLLTITNCSTLILLAGLLGTDPGWWIALLGCAATLLLRILGEREWRVERSSQKEAIWDDVLSTLQARDEQDQ